MNKENLNRRKFLKAMGLGATALAMPGFMHNVKRAGNGKKYNILFLVVDDLRPQIGCYGHKQMISPNIDRLASSGTIFNRTFCQVPVCGASRASLSPEYALPEIVLLPMIPLQIKNTREYRVSQNILKTMDTTPSPMAKCIII